MTVIFGQYPARAGVSAAEALFIDHANPCKISPRAERLIRALIDDAPIAAAGPLVETWDKAVRDYEVSMVFAARAAAILTSTRF
jgi:hypothetical protein